MSADKDTEAALKEEVKEDLKEPFKEDFKDELKGDKHQDINNLKAEDIAAPVSADTPTADAPLPVLPAETSAPEIEPAKPASQAEVSPEASKAAVQEATSHDTSSKEETTSQDAATKDIGAKEPASDKTSPEDAATKETTFEESAIQKDAPQEAAAALTTAVVVTAAAATEAVVEKAASLATPEVETAKPIDDFEDVPDPDEDDLDDLDDMLDDFSAVKIDQSKTVDASSSTKPEAPKEPAPSGKRPEVEDAFSEEEFAKQLQAGMADLLGELEQSPDMQAQFEDIFKHIAAAEGAGDVPPPSSSKGPASQAPPEDASFQDTIKRTMERMQASGDQATAAAASGSADDFMSEMLKQLSSGDLGDLGGEGSEEEFSKMLMGMMEQLTNKEILYEPMKELDEKFPEWLIKNRDTTLKDDLKRYEEQQSIVRQIVAKFEEKTYSDSNAADREFIVDKMQKMQAAGSPPSDLVGDMQSAQDALNPGDEACNPQ
ncbi:peroxisomal biogenesis factor 19 [Fusarium longipes]|uniref:Peroxisomal biogenesis factor 19 n=1 Tax=Fusarium longipes TaxID=694270 RepID=A0A395RHM4_9HYPO|nr:peroxisomal biogenesis factor 19 [Fusarium longipes]